MFLSFIDGCAIMRPKVYIEISNSYFFIGRLKKKKSFFFCTVSKKKRLIHGEVQEGIVCNPSFFFINIKKFIDEYNLVGARTVVCCPDLLPYGGLKKQMAFFQALLCVGKAGLKVDRFFDYYERK